MKPQSEKAKKTQKDKIAEMRECVKQYRKEVLDKMDDLNARADEVLKSQNKFLGGRG